ncbi:hypothetical protein J2T10_001805 [Paenarthrobacter nicotinovorans]|uniref:Uncharacterized protein n=1 Tax=Paenarthrobacter nicotinovorans TaxID=29320 RepID=A0ABT9TKJ3_PAENI|nr:hypothetical protein [Paenarthrobacter nicotinovorans]
MPIGPGWVDWLGDPVGIQKRLDWPRDGVLFDVRESAFWPEEWGERPTEVEEALPAARQRLRTVPVLVPIYSHRFMPAAPAPAGSPVFSVYQLMSSTTAAISPPTFKESSSTLLTENHPRIASSSGLTWQRAGGSKGVS